MGTALLEQSKGTTTNAVRGPSRLGELLVADGVISMAQLERALAEQRTAKLPLGRTLIRLNFITEDVMRQALGRQRGVPFLDLDKMTVDPLLARIIGRAYAKRHALVPVSRLGQTLTVAMDDPTAAGLAGELTRLTGHTITIVTASSDAIQRTFRQLYEGGAAAPGAPSEAASSAARAGANASPEPSGRADELFSQILGTALSHRTSDIHLEMLPTGLRIRFRIDGVLREAGFGASQQVFDRNMREIVSRIKILAKLDIAERRRPQDGSFQVPLDRDGRSVAVDLRVSVIPSYSGESVVIRVLDRSRAPRSLDQLDLSPTVRERLDGLLKRTTGIFLVTGPTGSGKSTTLYSCLMRVYTPEIRILTAEDPVEYVYEELSQSEVNETIGNTFAGYLRSFLRHDPEVIMIGEIRDEVTAEMAFRAAQTGHFLLSTLHTNSAIAALPRLLDLEIDPSMISSSLVGVMSQRLVRRLCQGCREPHQPAPELVQEFFGDIEVPFPLYRGAGCQACGHTGYHGRMVVVDLWAPDERDLMLITRQAPWDEIRTSAQRTTISMAEDASVRLEAGQTTLEELSRMLPYNAIVEHRERVLSAQQQREQRLLGVESVFGLIKHN